MFELKFLFAVWGEYTSKSKQLKAPQKYAAINCCIGANMNLLLSFWRLFNHVGIRFVSLPTFGHEYPGLALTDHSL